MSRLDRHVITIQNRLALGRFLQALAVSSFVFVALVWVTILVDRLTQMRPPRADVWFWIGAAAVVLISVVYAVVRRPTRHDAAVLIDQRLGLKEKFSTALYARSINDGFAKAAVTDAERTADNVSLRKRFPVGMPRTAFGTIAVALAALLTAQFMTPRDLFGRQERQQQQLAEQQKIDQARKVVEDAIAQVEAVPRGAADQEAINLALRELEEMLTQPMKDPEQARRTATRALQDVEEAIKQQIRQSGRYATAQTDARLYRSMTPPQDQQGPVAEAHRAMTKGDFAQAVAQLKEAVEKFDQMDEQAQQETVDQMKAMAQQLAELANNPQAEQQLQQQLQQMGANQEQAQQMARQMQAAARGDQQAQQQLAQQAQQMLDQMPAEQQQQMRQMMQQMQAQANSQAQAQAMAQAAQQMAQAMEQQAGQQAGQDGQQPDGAGEQMADAQQQMMEQLQQMQAMQQDAEQLAAAQAAAAAAAQGAADQMNQGQQQQGGRNQPGQWQGEWGRQDGEGQANNGGRGHAEQGVGGVREVGLAPGAFQQENAESQEDEEGRVLAAWYVKDESLKGEARVQLRKVLEASRNEATDEVDQERISLQSQRVVRDYFNSMERELE
jgi:hypothetical protein